MKLKLLLTPKEKGSFEGKANNNDIQSFLSEKMKFFTEDNVESKVGKKYESLDPWQFFIDLLLLNIGNLKAPEEVSVSSKSPIKPKPKNAEWSILKGHPPQIVSNFLLDNTDKYQISIIQEGDRAGDITIKKNSKTLEEIDQGFANSLVAALRAERLSLSNNTSPKKSSNINLVKAADDEKQQKLKRLRIVTQDLSERIKKLPSEPNIISQATAFTPVQIKLATADMNGNISDNVSSDDESNPEVITDEQEIFNSIGVDNSNNRLTPPKLIIHDSKIPVIVGSKGFELTLSMVEQTTVRTPTQIPIAFNSKLLNRVTTPSDTSSNEELQLSDQSKNGSVNVVTTSSRSSPTTLHVEGGQSDDEELKLGDQGVNSSANVVAKATRRSQIKKKLMDRVNTIQKQKALAATTLPTQDGNITNAAQDVINKSTTEELQDLYHAAVKNQNNAVVDNIKSSKRSRIQTVVKHIIVDSDSDSDEDEEKSIVSTYDAQNDNAFNEDRNVALDSDSSATNTLSIQVEDDEVDRIFKDILSGDKSFTTQSTTPLKSAIEAANKDEVIQNITSGDEFVEAFNMALESLLLETDISNIFEKDTRQAKLVEDLIKVAAVEEEYVEAWATITNHSFGEKGKLTDPEVLNELDDEVLVFLAAILPENLVYGEKKDFASEWSFLEEEKDGIRNIRENVKNDNNTTSAAQLNQKIAKDVDEFVRQYDKNLKLKYSDEEQDLDTSYSFNNNTVSEVRKIATNGKTSNRYMEAFRLALQYVASRNISEDKEQNFRSWQHHHCVTIDKSSIQFIKSEPELIYMIKGSDGYPDEIHAPTNEDVEKYADFFGVTQQYQENVKLLEWQKVPPAPAEQVVENTSIPSTSPQAPVAEKIADTTLYRPVTIGDGIWKDKERGNKLKVVNGVYGVKDEDDQNAIEQTLFDIIAKVAADQEPPLNIKRVLEIIDKARTQGGIKNKWEEGVNGGGHYAPADAVELDAKRFSRDFQRECEACGILSGRGTSNRGLRTTFIPLSVTQELEKLRDGEKSHFLEGELEGGKIKVSNRVKDNLEKRENLVKQIAQSHEH